MSLAFAIKGFLAEKPRTGYELKTQCFDGPALLFWHADQAQIYRTLAQLEAQGDVTSSHHTQTDRPNKKLYTLTAQGRRTLDTWLAQPSPSCAVRDPFALKTFMAARLKPSLLERLYADQEHALTAQLARERAAASAYRHTHARPSAADRQLDAMIGRTQSQLETTHMDNPQVRTRERKSS